MKLINTLTANLVALSIIGCGSSGGSNSPATASCAASALSNHTVTFDNGNGGLQQVTFSSSCTYGVHGCANGGIETGAWTEIGAGNGPSGSGTARLIPQNTTCGNGTNPVTCDYAISGGGAQPLIAFSCR
jgi:hypothetical protein